MHTETRAAGTKTRPYTGRTTGFRRLSMASLATDCQAQDFVGFGDNGPRPVQILGAFKAAAPFLGYGAKIVHAIDWLFRFTSPQDWREGARPIVWPSARMQQEELQLSPTRTKVLNRLLIELGLIAAKDSPNGKRYGRRDREGRIVEAYGFDLSPLAQRLEEFERIAQEGRAVRARMGQLRRRATVARKSIAQIMEAVAEYRLMDDIWLALQDETRVLSVALRRVERLEEMEIGVIGLERRQAEAQTRLTMQTEEQMNVNKDPKGPDSGPHIYTYKPPLNPIQDTVAASDGSSSAVAKPPETAKRPPVQTEAEERGRVLRLYPDEVAVIAPRLGSYLRVGDPKWADVVNAADGLRRDLDISRPLWVEACQAMGREMAAIAVAVVSTKDSDYFTRTAGHYFHGMVERAKRGELHLDRTLWGLRSGKREKSMEGRA
ncbi:MAG: plasmid replication protein RepC [Bradyrhizobium sp.]|nr:plasmid replication protein RepC [Bradyrhizobium sp.]